MASIQYQYSPDQQRNRIVQRFVRGLTFEEIAKLEGCEVEWVERQLRHVVESQHEMNAEQHKAIEEAVRASRILKQAMWELSGEPEFARDRG